MDLSDMAFLFRHYWGLFGLRSVALLADRWSRKVFPAQAYLPVWWVLWGRAGRSKARVDDRTEPQRAGFRSHGTKEFFEQRFPNAVRDKVAATEGIGRKEFDFLGTGPTNWGDPIDWHRDVKSGHRWPLRFYSGMCAVLMPGDGADVKVPWELSRFHHVVTLAQAWWLSGEVKYADEFFSQWESWLVGNPWPRGVNWTNAMEAAIRAVNLLQARELMAEAPGWSPGRRATYSQSLREHGLFIEHNLEVAVRRGEIVAGNHYLANVCGLACLGLGCPELPEAARWRRVGLAALEAEIRRQVLDDGFFWESSTAYHRLALELFLVPAVVARNNGHRVSDFYWSTLERMCEVVLYLTGPSGQVPQIGDNDDGRLLILGGYPHWPRHDHRYLLALGAALFSRGDFKAAAGECSEDVFWLLGRRGVEDFDASATDSTPVGSKAFPDAGLYVIRSHDNDDYAVVRTSTVSGPTGHAHNDCLSVELWMDGKPVFVDAGTLCYTSDLAARNEFRSTAAHNTVMVNGAEITPLPSGEPFKLDVSASVRVLEWHVGQEEVRIVAESDAFSPVVHKRSVTYRIGTREWLIADTLIGSGSGRWSWHMPSGLDALSFAVQVSFPIEEIRRPGRLARSYGVAEPCTVWEMEGEWTGEAQLDLALHSQLVEVGAGPREVGE